MGTKYALTVLAVTCALLAPTAAGACQSHDLNSARSATKAYRNIDTAVAAGYGLLTDAAKIACIDKPGAGGMGIHYVKGSLVGDGAVYAPTPEALVYEPTKNGKLSLVALEYVVFQDAWDKAHTSKPSLFGRHFMLVPAGNRYGLPAFYELHVWIWKKNPSGMFNDWNPRVSCASAK
jgi:hypothetical protein